MKNPNLYIYYGAPEKTSVRQTPRTKTKRIPKAKWNAVPPQYRRSKLQIFLDTTREIALGVCACVAVAAISIFILICFCMPY